MPIATAVRIDPALGAGNLGETIGRLAERSLVLELELTPKPGLVDRANCGSHRDMNLGTFRASIAAISPWFSFFFERGVDGSAVPAQEFLQCIRADGMACERAMFSATAGVNTHKGSVFSFGLLCAAAGRLHGRNHRLARTNVCTEVARLCSGLVQREMSQAASARTAGELLYLQHGLTGARGEAQSGFATARTHGVVPYLLARAKGMDEDQALFETLLHLMAHNQDTNIVSRGGMEGLCLVQTEARRLLDCPTPSTQARITQLATFDQLLIKRNLSPGGSADLLAVSWFLANLDALAYRADI